MTEFGHGILDIYAALNPITTSAYTRIYTGKSTEVGEEYQLGNSKLLASNSLGDSLQRGLIKEKLDTPTMIWVAVLSMT